MSYTPQEFEQALQAVVSQVEVMGDKNHRAWYYTASDIEKGESYLAILKLLRFDKENRATNLAEIRNQLTDDLMGPYFFLQMTIQLMNEKGITLIVKDILETLVPWLWSDQIIWFTDYKKEPGLVSIYPTDQDLKLKPTQTVIVVYWYSLIIALSLVLPTELCDHIRQNSESHNHFFAMLFSYKTLEENLKWAIG